MRRVYTAPETDARYQDGYDDGYNEGVVEGVSLATVNPIVELHQGGASSSPGKEKVFEATAGFIDTVTGLVGFAGFIALAGYTIRSIITGPERLHAERLEAEARTATAKRDLAQAIDELERTVECLDRDDHNSRNR